MTYCNGLVAKDSHVAGSLILSLNNSTPLSNKREQSENNSLYLSILIPDEERKLT